MKAIARCVFAALFVLAMTGPALGQGKDGDDIKNCYSVRGEARSLSLSWCGIHTSPRQSPTVVSKSRMSQLRTTRSRCGTSARRANLSR